MSGGEGALIAAMLGSSVLSGIFAPEGQELRSFAGRGTAAGDPRELLKNILGKTEGVFSGLTERAAQPVQLRSTAPSLPTFAGGGLPFAIGAPAQDPALYDPSRLSIPGVNLRGAPRTTLPRTDGPTPDPNNPPSPPPERPRPNVAQRSLTGQPTAATPSTGVLGLPPTGDPEADQAAGAVQMLLGSLVRGQRQPGGRSA